MSISLPPSLSLLLSLPLSEEKSNKQGALPCNETSQQSSMCGTRKTDGKREHCSETERLSARLLSLCLCFTARGEKKKKKEIENRLKLSIVKVICDRRTEAGV